MILVVGFPYLPLYRMVLSILDAGYQAKTGMRRNHHGVCVLRDGWIGKLDISFGCFRLLLGSLSLSPIWDGCGGRLARASVTFCTIIPPCLDVSRASG